MNVIVIYDDTGRRSEVIADIIGDTGFADVVVKKRRLEEYYKDEISKLFPEVLWRKVHSVFEYADIIKELEQHNGNWMKVIHCFSNYLITDGAKARLSFGKLPYIDRQFGVLDGKKAVAAMFPDTVSYTEFCRKIMSGQRAWDIARNMSETFEIKGLVDIGVIGNFIQCITGNFDSRYFNSLEGNEYTIIKSSSNKRKIKAEYTFYHLLPEDMRFWFVMPFDYREDKDSASYTMERFHMTDLAVKWVHGSIEKGEFEELMDKYFFFFKSRHARECTDVDYRQITDALYDGKVRNRIADLKEFPQYQKIKSLLEILADADIDALVSKYFRLRKAAEGKVHSPHRLVIGHGDPCFANTLYNKSTKTLKFIDPKGALTEEELWTDPYYDVAKLSHSVCGRYDFFNNGLFDIRINDAFSYELDISFDNTMYKDIFKTKAEENGFDYLLVRIYEASLFLSMLPLHIDNPYKVFGFILNVKNILEEIEINV